MGKIKTKKQKGAKVMCKKVLITAVLCVGLVAMCGIAEVKAWPRVAGWGVSCPDLNGDGLPDCSLYCDALLKGVGNPDVNPTSVDCILANTQMRVMCANNGDNDGGVGRVFTLEGTTYQTIDINWDNFTSKGQAVADVYFSDCSFYDTVKDVTDVCINPNWYIIPPAGWTPDWEEGDACEENPELPGGTFTILDTDVAIVTNADDGYYYAVAGNCTLDSVSSEYMCTEYARGRCDDSTCSNIFVF